MTEPRATTSFVDFETVALRCRVEGGGDPSLLLIHEMGGYLECWDRLVPLFAGDHRMLRYDQRGHGLSEKVRTMTIDQLVDDALAVADAFGLSRFIPVGCAVGGAVALALASRHPGRCHAVVALAPATVLPAERKGPAQARADAIEANGVRAGQEESLGRSYPPVLRKDVNLFQTVRGMRLGADPEGFAAMLRMLAQLDIGSELAAIDVPALVLAGRYDGDRPPEHLSEIAAIIPHALFEIIESGHFMALHAPELVADAMRRFFAGALDVRNRKIDNREEINGTC